MKKKLVLLSGFVFLALVISMGAYAYTYTTATATMGLTVAGDEIATYEPALDQPSWDDTLPWGEQDQEILLPDGPGDMTKIPVQYPAGGQHWEKVDDEFPDDMETYIASAYLIEHEADLYDIAEEVESEASLKLRYKTDLYNIADHIDGEGNVKGITVYFRFAGYEDGHPRTAYAKAVIKTGGEVYEGTEESQTGQEFVTRAYVWTTNPATGEDWTWDEVDSLQAGVSLAGESKRWPAYCTQVVVMVDYEVMVIEGEVPMGDLYTITPHSEYPGDLLVKLYITNTNNLIKAYQHLNMKLYVEGSIEASMEPDYRVLSLENGVVSFNIVGGTAENYTIKVIGGGYRMISDDAYQWGEGWTNIPEFYCEVDQK